MLAREEVSGLTRHNQPLAHCPKFGANLAPNIARNTGFYPVYRFITSLECAADQFVDTFTLWKS